MLIQKSPSTDTFRRTRGIVDVLKGVLKLCYKSPKLWGLQHVPHGNPSYRMIIITKYMLIRTAFFTVKTV
jgi:hypothetical protein